MTHLYTDTSKVDSPMWLFHLPTFTLAQLHLNGGPSGNHLLTFIADGFPPAEALASFSATLEAMAPSASDRLTTVSRADAAQVLPEFLRFSPEKSIPGSNVSHSCPALRVRSRSHNCGNASLLAGRTPRENGTRQINSTSSYSLR